MDDIRNYLLVILPLVGVIIGGLITSVTKWIELRNQRDFDLGKAQLLRLEAIHVRLTSYLEPINDFTHVILELSDQKGIASDVIFRGLVAGLRLQHPAWDIASHVYLNLPELDDQSAVLIGKVGELTKEANEYLRFCRAGNQLDASKSFDKLCRLDVEANATAVQLQLKVGAAIRSKEVELSAIPILSFFGSRRGDLSTQSTPISRASSVGMYES